jgi:hypothetical protein
MVFGLKKSGSKDCHEGTKTSKTSTWTEREFAAIAAHAFLDLAHFGLFTQIRLSS